MEQGKKIEKLRKDKGLTQAQLGKKIGYSQRTVSTFEKPGAVIPGHILLKISKVLEISISDLLAEEEKNPRNVKQVSAADIDLMKKVIDLQAIVLDIQQRVTELEKAATGFNK